MSTVSLRSLFEFSGALIERGAAESAKAESGRAAPLTLVGFVAEAGAKRLNEVLDTDVFALLADAWLVFKQVLDCADPATHPPGQDTIVKLHEVEIELTNAPVLHATVGGVALPDLRFTLALVASFKVVDLIVRDARILALRPGGGSAIVKLSYGNAKLVERSTPEWNLPTEIALGEAGIAIPRQGH